MQYLLGTATLYNINMIHSTNTHYSLKPKTLFVHVNLHIITSPLIRGRNKKCRIASDITTQILFGFRDFLGKNKDDIC